MVWMKLQTGLMINLEQARSLQVGPSFDSAKAKAGVHEVRYQWTLEGPTQLAGEFPTKAMADAFVAGLGLSIKS